MKWLVALFFGILVLTLGVSSFAATSCKGLIGTCDYYKCLSDSLGCEQKNYLTEFAYRYCAKYERQRDQYSDAAKQFLSEVKACLQTKIEEDPEIRACSDFAAKTPEHHFECYTELGFCRLPGRDRSLLAESVLSKILRDGAYRWTAWRIAGYCLSHGAN